LPTTTFTYDEHGRLATTTAGNGAEAREITRTYGADGFLETAVDALGRTVSYEQDAVGRVTSVVLPGERPVQLEYDAEGHLITLRPPGRGPYRFNWNEGDELSTSVAPDGATTTYHYDDDRQLSGVTLPTGEVHAFAYDGVGRLDGVTTPGDDVDLGYDDRGRLTTLADSGGVTVTASYDGTLQTAEAWSGTVAGSVSRSFNDEFRVVSDQVGGGESISYTYDEDGFLRSAGDALIERDARGLLTSSAIGSSTESVTYNTFGEPLHHEVITGSSGEPVYAADLEHDALGRVTGLTESIDGTTTTWSYAYDPAGRLATVDRDGDQVAAFTYDLNGNRTSVQRPIGTEEGTYDDLDRLVSYDGANYVSDEAGVLQSITNDAGTTTFEYDTRGNLLHVELPDGQEVEYVVDGRDRRVERRVDGIPTQRWLYDGQLRPIAELRPDGTILSRFVYGVASNVPDYFVREGRTYRIVADHLGSPRLVIDTADGTVVQRMDFDEYGRVLADTNPGFQPFGFAGGLYDPITGLVRFGARDYDAVTGRWTAPDPVGFEADTNLYTYAQDIPTSFVDPAGDQQYSYRRARYRVGGTRGPGPSRWSYEPPRSEPRSWTPRSGMPDAPGGVSNPVDAAAQGARDSMAEHAARMAGSALNTWSSYEGVRDYEESLPAGDSVSGWTVQWCMDIGEGFETCKPGEFYPDPTPSDTPPCAGTCIGPRTGPPPPPGFVYPSGGYRPRTYRNTARGKACIGDFSPSATAGFA
jgi:RHS repeat-associated protein